MRLLPFELEWVRIVTRALLPPDVLGGVLANIDTGERFDREMARSPWYAALGMRASLWLTWLAPVWLLGHAQTFAQVTDEQKVEILEKLLKHPRYALRMAATFLKLTLCTLALGDERVMRALEAYDYPRLQARSAS